ncbi:MAG TPA: DnaJ domain-containing protein [Patescibacteria group bacterium]|jgi:curved DNA-binding protein CbpA|nr:DnaJ domain-containing protein [Patescibacteria group bacterium]
MLERVEGDAYVVLGLSRDADDAAVARAHRRLARRHHPDVAGDAASRRMMRINAAYDAIKTAERRAAYERDHRESTPHDGTGGAGDPPGNPSGSVVPFGRHVGWSLGEIARIDPGYLLWLAERPEGARYRDEINGLLSRMGMRTAGTDPTPPWRRGLPYR